MHLKPDTALRTAALLAGTLVVLMLAIFVLTGIGQDPLQYVHPAADYARILLRDPPMLRAAIGLDNLFIMAYGTVFVLLASTLWQDPAARALLVVALPAMIAVAVLDAAENLHFLVMLAGAEQGQPPGSAEIAWQAGASMFKFHISYLGLILFGLALPRHHPRWRALAFLLIFAQAPIGVAIYVAPKAVALPLVFARFGFFLASFAILASIRPDQVSIRAS